MFFSLFWIFSEKFQLINLSWTSLWVCFILFSRSEKWLYIQFKNNLNQSFDSSKYSFLKIFFKSFKSIFSKDFLILDKFTNSFSLIIFHSSLNSGNNFSKTL